MPLKGWKMHLIGYPAPFSSNMLFEPQIQPQILTNHIRFSPAVTNLMPKAKKITILRNPVSQFRSIFEYFHHIGVFSSLPRREKGLELFFESPEAFMSNDTRWGKWLARNINFFDLGEDNEIFNETEIAKKVEEIFEKIDFFMMTDYILESLILLKRIF